MAIYHFSIKNIGRSNGRSAVAAAAYRSGEKLVDSVYGKEQDYTKKTGVEYKNIYVPSHANEHLLDRQTLWNEVEKSELKKNGDLKTTARLAKEFEIAFPHEVDADTRKRMLDDLAQTLVKNHNVIVDAVIHAPHTKSGSDERNYHGHIMFTTRSINEQGELGKKAREFNDDGKNLTLAYRELWANMVNRELEQLGTQERVSHLSYSDLKYDLEPTVHEGSQITQLRRQGIDTEISLKNDAIKARNAEKLEHEQIIKGLDQEIIATNSVIIDLKRSQLNEVEQTRSEPSIQNKNALERKLEPSSRTPQNSSLADKKIVVDLFHTKVRVLAEKNHSQQLETIRQKMSAYMELSKNLLNQIEAHKQNKPLNPFKINAWTKELNHLIQKHDDGIKAPHDSLLSEYRRIKSNGVTHEHWKNADAQMYQLDKNAYQIIKALEIELNERNSATSITKSAELDNAKGR